MSLGVLLGGLVLFTPARAQTSCPTRSPQALIASVGDSSVIMHFNAWMDRREADYKKVYSEAVRLLKKALDDAGMDLPEPIYRVQLSGQDVTGAPKTATGKKFAPTAPKPVSTARSTADDAQQDVSVDHALDEQIALERESAQGEDLLQHPAPREYPSLSATLSKRRL